MLNLRSITKLLFSWFPIFLSIIISILTANTYALSWNDGSRFAMVQALVETNTFIIDDTIFIINQNRSQLGPPFPYDPNTILNRTGTQDKLFISGHFYSDKSPVPGLIMATVWRILSIFGLPEIRENPRLFIFLLNLLFAGVPYVISTWCIMRLAHHFGLSRELNLLLGISFSLSVAAAYAGSVNSHILALCSVCLSLVLFTSKNPTFLKCFILGLSIGFGYTTDLGSGPALLIPFSILVLTYFSFFKLIFFLLGASIFIFIHHYLNYQIAGTFFPANSIPEYLAWPGSPFNESNMTGGLKHKSLSKLAIYTGDLLFGKKGFLLHFPVLIYAFFASFRLLYLRHRESFLIFMSQVSVILIITTYAVSSNNLSGLCLSIRWFLPIIGFGYLIIVLSLRQFPHHALDLSVLGCAQMILGIEGIYRSCWWGHVLPFYWAIIAISLTSWGILNSIRFMRWVRSLW